MTKRLKRHSKTNLQDLVNRFQIEAIDAIEKKQTVIVSVKTGKTTIAEYAIETSLSNNDKIIYTSPIKELSNQRFRELSVKYSDKVGIITEDVSINPQAPVLIMTADIFRNTIFDSPKMLSNVRYAILDEMHLLNDIGYGTVWEECIVFAPEWIEFLCLIDTIPNLTELAKWIGSARKRSVRIIREEDHHVPFELKYFSEKHGIVSFDELRSLNNLSSEERVKLINKNQTDVISIICNQDKLPCVYFSTNRRRCEELAYDYLELALFKKSGSEKTVSVYDKLCLEYGLSEDRTASLMRELVESGIAYYHAGLILSMRLVIEQLFTMGFLKLIFATELFAMVVNIPAQTVVIDELEKFDGNRRRHLRASEFRQLSGKSETRKADERRLVFVKVEPFDTELPIIEKITTGEVEEVKSQFELSYSVILNLYERYGHKIYGLLEKSFKMFQMTGPLSEIGKKLSSLEQVEKVHCPQGKPDTIEKYNRLTDILTEQKRNFKRDSRKARKEFKNDKWTLRAVIQELKANLSEYEQRRKDLPCHSCPKLGKCLKGFQKKSKINKTSSDLIERKKKLEKDVFQDVARKISFLESLDYIDGLDLTPKGRFASHIYGHEIQTTEIMCNGYFDLLDETGINIIAAAIVFESHPDVFYQKLSSEKLNVNFAELNQLIQSLVRRQFAFGIDEPLELLDNSLGSIVNAWCEGCDFDELLSFTDADEGDIIMGLRSAINLLRQVEKASWDEHLKAKVKSAISLMKMDIVDAESELI